MTIQTYALAGPRLGKYKAEILKHAEPLELLSKEGRQVMMPPNSSDTYVARRFLPYGATATDANSINRFFQNATGDRGNAITQAHLTQEGVTPLPEGITPQDVTVVVQQYSCLYGFTDKTFYLYEDKIPEEMIRQVGERMTFVNELICHGALKACTNVFFGGTGVSRSTVNGSITLTLLRAIARSLRANHAKQVNAMLAPLPEYDTTSVEPAYSVYAHTDTEGNIRDLPNFEPANKYKSMPNEIGKCEGFRFFTSPDFPSYQDAGASIGATNLYSTSGTSVDVYPFIVTGKDAWSQISVRGIKAMDAVYEPPGVSSKADVFGQRGYAGAMWWKAVLVENNGWMAVANVGFKTI